MTNMLPEPITTNTLNARDCTEDVEEKVECPAEDEQKKSTKNQKLVFLFRDLFKTYRLMIERLKENDHAPIKVISGLYIGSIGIDDCSLNHTSSADWCSSFHPVGISKAATPPIALEPSSFSNGLAAALNNPRDSAADNRPRGGRFCEWGAKSKESLKDVGITHVLSCAAIIPPQFPEDFEYLHLSLEDTAAQNIDDMFDRGIPFIVHALKNGGKVFVHCFAGKSRATTMCCAYLIHSMRIPFSKALEMVKEVRPIADPNIGFRHELVKFANSLGISDPSIENPQPVRSTTECET